MLHDPTAEQVIEEWAAMVERLYGTATPTASTDPAMSAPPTKPQPTCCPATAASSTRPLHGKEGVDGSSPSEGSAKAPHVGAFSFRSTCCSSNVQWVWSRLWSFHASARLRHVVCERFAGDRLGSHPRVGVLGGQGFDWLSSPRRAIVGRPTNRPGGA
jgi:hypothetical protein